MRPIGFDIDTYLTIQSQQILNRVKSFDKLYLEFGGKLVGDKHAKRVLPGFHEDAKMILLTKLAHQAEIIITVYSGDIVNHKIRSDYGIPYNEEVIRLIEEYTSYNIPVNSVLITRYNQEPTTKAFIRQLKNRNIKVYTHSAINGYPTDIDTMFGPEGFAKNQYIPTTRPLIILSAPGAGSGKLATCLNQLYHDHQANVKAGYAKFETFPVWNLPINHPVNIAYEAATVDLNDFNMIDNYHYEAYGEMAVTYNRDNKMFPVIRRIMTQITGGNPIYHSPTDMGVNTIKQAIIDDDIVSEAAHQEIIRRYFATERDYFMGTIDDETHRRMQFILEESGLTPQNRSVVEPARVYEEAVKQRFNTDKTQGVIALELADGRIITGRTTDLMDAASTVIVNSLKALAEINDSIDLLAPMVLNTIQDMKSGPLNSKITSLTANEILIALSISAVTNPTAKAAYDQLGQLDGCQAHASFLLEPENEQTLKRLGIDITSDPIYLSKG